MKARKIAAMIRERWDKTDMAFQALVLSFDAEAIHRFRVEVKKLRAFLRLTESTGYRRGSLALPKKLHRFYQLTGIIRNLQLQQQNIRKAWASREGILPEEPLPGSYPDLLNEEAMATILRAKNLAIKKADLKKEKRRILSRLAVRPGRRSVEKFAGTKIKDLRHLLGPSIPTDESLHSARKILKDLLYTWAFTGQVVMKILPGPPPPGYEELDSLTGLLGDFQDSCIAIGLLGAGYTDRVVSGDERTMLWGVRGEWQQEKERKGREVYALLRKRLGHTGRQDQDDKDAVYSI